MKKYLTDLMLGAGVRILGSRLQSRGRIASFSVLYDDQGIRAILYDDGTVDSIRRRPDGQESVVLQGRGIAMITRNAEGLMTSVAAFDNIDELPAQGDGAGLATFDMFTADATLPIPHPVTQEPGVSIRAQSEGEYIHTVLEAGFTEHQQTDSTHKFTITTGVSATEERSQIMNISALEAV